MYISEISITNFRTFKEQTTIEFHEGINVIIGHNNAGKTSLLKALELLFDSEKNKRLSIDDFNKNTTIEELKSSPPKIIISATLKESDQEEEYSDDLVTVSTWLTRLERPYEAKITYEFFLPDKELEDYQKLIGDMEDSNINSYWNEIENSFLRKYVYKIYVGDPQYKNVVDAESRDKFSFQFLTAIRDVERDLFTGRNALLKEVIDFFMDYDVKENQDLNEDEKIGEIQKRKKKFKKTADMLIREIQERMQKGKEHMLRYVKSTGASFDKIRPSFEGSILDTELYSALSLIVENETGIKLPAVNNGLGYNNLIYISLLLAKMQKDASGSYYGSNAKVFSILAIEEPEAHLHPSMQYKFLKFLKENRETEVRQIFITSHSPNITAAVDLDDIIVLYKDDETVKAAYPGKVFSNSDEDIKSKKYVQRFIDVTKADIFFARRLILVEGLAEQLLIPEFARYLECDLTETHTSVINIGGKYFDHFLKLFDLSGSSYAIKKKIACITDLDPVRKKNVKNARWKACLPLFLGIENEIYEYKACSNNLVENKKYQSNNLIKVFSQKVGESSTFEYDLILKNITSEELIVDCISKTAREEIRNLMKAYKNGESAHEMLTYLRNNDYKEEVEKAVNCSSSPLSDDEKKKHIIAGLYLKSIKKGETAQELSHVVSSQINDNVAEEKNKILCPDYIKEAIQWITQEP